MAGAFNFSLAAQETIDIGAATEVSLDESTAAVSIITSEELSHRSAKNVKGSMLGQGLGLVSLYDGGTKYLYQDWDLYVRGLQSLNGNNAPLILVDGIERSIESVSSEEVDKIVILKDAAAVALYGYKGINGAIQITTKRGQYNTREVKFTYDHQFNTLVNKPKFADAYTYGLAINEARANDGLSARYSSQELDALKNGTYPTLYPNVNWVDETFRNTASTDNFNMEFRGGEEKFRYYAMLDLISDRGFVRNDNLNSGYSTQDKYVRGNLRMNMDIDLTPTTELKVNLLGMLLENSNPGDLADLWDMVYTLPAAAFPIKDASGVWAGSNTWEGTSNPVAQSSGAAYYKNHNRLLYTDITLNQDLSAWVDGLGAFIKVGYDNIANIYEDHSKTYVYSVTVPTWAAGASEPTSTTSTYGSDSEMGSDANANTYSRRSHLEAGALFNRSFGKHALNTQLKWNYEFYDANGINTKLYRHDISWWTHYGYNGKYFADLALVESGSSRLAPGTKWNFSPTLSLAWVVSNEDFVDAEWIDLLKLRASAGILNADYLPDDLWTYYIQQYQTSGVIYPFSSGFASDFTKTYLGRLATSNPANERAFKYNVGVDGRLFDNSLSLTFDAFYQRRDNIWVEASGKYTDLIGLDAPYENAGIVDSRGVELGADYTKHFGDVTLNLGGNFNFNRNKIIEMLEEPRLYDNLVQTGHRVGQIYGLKAIGFFENQADIDNSPAQNFSTVRPGDLKYEDVNGDGQIDANDVVAIGYSSTAPEIYYNFHIGAEWKGLGFYALFQGTGNYSTILNTKSLYVPLIDNTTISEYYWENRWTTSNTNAKFPRLSSRSNANNTQTNTAFLADRSYLKLRNAEVYYKLPQRLLDKSGFVKGAKLYVQGNDLFCLDKLDVGDADSPAGDPLYRSVVLGVRLTF